jgi:hypothetical protein
MMDDRIQVSSRDPLTGDGESSSSCCPVLNFFASTASAERWLAARTDVQGAAISMPEAIAAGRTVFGDVLKEG